MTEFANQKSIFKSLTTTTQQNGSNSEQSASYKATPNVATKSRATLDRILESTKYNNTYNNMLA